MTTSKTTQPYALAALREITRSLSSAVDLETTLNLVAQKTTAVMHVDSCSVYLLEGDETTLRLKATTGLEPRMLGRASLQVGEGMTGVAVRDIRPIYARVAQSHADFKLVNRAREERFESLLAIPLLLESKPIGALNVQTLQPHDFDSAEIEMLSIIGDVAAGALIKAQLLDAEKTQLRELRELSAENSRLATQAAIVREMHHRIKNNLQMVAMLMQLQIPDAARLDTREVLESNIHRIGSIATVHEVLSEKGYHLVDVTDVLTRIARATMQALSGPGHEIVIVVRGEPVMLPSKEATSLALVVNELMQNAVEHAFVGRGGGRIEVSLGLNSAETIITVRDNGNGLPTEVVPNLGLEITETLICEDLGGTINFHRLTQGTEIGIRIPRKRE